MFLAAGLQVVLPIPKCPVDITITAVEEQKSESSNMPLEAGPREMVVIHKTESFIQNVFYAFNRTVLLFSCVYQITQNYRSLSQ